MFCRRWKCFKISKTQDEDFATYGANVNRICEEFKLAELTADQFKSLIFILGLRGSADVDISTRLHNFLDVDASRGKLETLVTEANRIINVNADVKLGTESRAPTVAAIARKSSYNRNKNNNKTRSSGPTPAPKPK